MSPDSTIGNPFGYFKWLLTGTRLSNEILYFEKNPPIPTDVTRPHYVKEKLKYHYSNAIHFSLGSDLEIEYGFFEQKLENVKKKIEEYFFTQNLEEKVRYIRFVEDEINHLIKLIPTVVNVELLHSNLLIDLLRIEKENYLRLIKDITVKPRSVKSFKLIDLNFSYKKLDKLKTFLIRDGYIKDCPQIIWRQVFDGLEITRTREKIEWLDTSIHKKPYKGSLVYLFIQLTEYKIIRKGQLKSKIKKLFCLKNGLPIKNLYDTAAGKSKMRSIDSILTQSFK